jgi:DNA processing protein
MSEPLTADVRDLLALHLAPGLGPRLTAALLERFGSATAALRATPQQLAEVPHIGTKLANDLYQAFQRVEVDAELERLARHGVQLLSLGAPAYPATLATIYDPPHLLYVRGSLLPRDANAVALVGSRHCTTYGRKVTERLAAGLARAGLTVISGLARGIDGVAHRAALDAGGRTLAVLAGGLARIYPPEHADLAEAVAGAGALLSEASMDMEPMAGMFPARNRLISGLARAVVVIEAAQRSGALITATHAAEQGREVFAVPGNVDSSASAGALELLRKGARLVRSADDILEELDGTAPLVPLEPVAAPSELTESERRAWDCLSGQGRHMDEITRELGLPVMEVSKALMTLEMKKLVRRLPGNRFERR